MTFGIESWPFRMSHFCGIIAATNITSWGSLGASRFTCESTHTIHIEKRHAACASLRAASDRSVGLTRNPQCMNCACQGVCPESKRRYPGDCRLFYRCVLLPVPTSATYNRAPGVAHAHVWIPTRCTAGLVSTIIDVLSKDN